MNLRVGLIVNYKTTEQQQVRMGEHHSVCNVCAELPAVVTAVWSNNLVNLKVFHDGQGETWATSSPQGDEEGCWNFYPEEKAVSEKKGKDKPTDVGENTANGAEEVQ